MKIQGRQQCQPTTFTRQAIKHKLFNTNTLPTHNDHFLSVKWWTAIFKLCLNDHNCSLKQHLMKAHLFITSFSMMKTIPHYIEIYKPLIDRLMPWQDMFDEPVKFFWVLHFLHNNFIWFAIATVSNTLHPNQWLMVQWTHIPSAWFFISCVTLVNRDVMKDARIGPTHF